MQIIQILFLLFIGSHLLYSQEKEELNNTRVDEITYNWDIEASSLSTYEGLRLVCTDKPYRERIISMLKEIHHLDSVLYDVLIDLSRTNPNGKIRKTLRDIERFENEYDTKSFIRFMSQECKASREAEKNAKNTRNEVGESSYSGQIYIIETELYKYVKQVTKRVDKIRKHVHHLSPYLTSSELDNNY